MKDVESEASFNCSASVSALCDKVTPTLLLLLNFTANHQQ